jgi:chorismate dehydratase
MLCAKHWHMTAEFFEADPDLPAMLNQADAALLIGDPAMHLAFAANRSGKRGGTNTPRGSGPSAGAAKAPPPFVYDIVEEWRQLTNLPAVLAVWAARAEAVRPEVVSDFQQSLAFGLQHLDAIAGEAAKELSLRMTDLRQYLDQNIVYTLDEENLRGLQRFFDLAVELGLIQEAKPLRIATFDQTAELANLRRN